MSSGHVRHVTPVERQLSLWNSGAKNLLIHDAPPLWLGACALSPVQKFSLVRPQRFERGLHLDDSGTYNNWRPK